MISHETDPVQKNVARAKLEAVMSIIDGDNPRILVEKLLAYFDEDIAEAESLKFVPDKIKTKDFILRYVKFDGMHLECVLKHFKTYELLHYCADDHIARLISSQ